MPRPIFVVGIQRSGTTWLANELTYITNAVGVTSGEFGTRESHYFNYYANRFGDITQPDNFALFASLLLNSDFFTLVGLDKKFLESLYSKDYTTIFYHIMTRYAEEHQAAYWVEKTPNHTTQMDHINRAYTNALFIATRRNLVDVFTSVIVQERLWDNTLRRLLRMITHTLRHAYYDKCISRFDRDHNNIVIVDFEEMKADINKVIMSIIDALELDGSYEPSEGIKYKKNTSYRIADFMLSTVEQHMLRLIYRLALLIPFVILALIFRIRHQMQSRTLPIRLFRINFPRVAKADPIVAEIMQSETEG